MSKDSLVPPEWQPVALVCPKCRVALRARYNPNTGVLDELRCLGCGWRHDYAASAKQRTARLAAARRRCPSSKHRQTRFN